jgi:hypothetical protein
MANGELPIHFADSTLGAERHICAFFNSREEEYRVLLPFIREGFERGDSAFHIVDPQLEDDHVHRLQGAGIDTDGASKKGQLIVKRWQEAYLQDGHFDQDRMLSMIEGVLSSAEAEGKPMVRLVAHMEWALQDFPWVNDLVEYETRANFVVPKYKHPCICTYDCTRFGAGVAMDILRTHPMVILGGVLQKNPFYVQPVEFLAELRERGTYTSRPARA